MIRLLNHNQNLWCSFLGLYYSWLTFFIYSFSELLSKRRLRTQETSNIKMFFCKKIYARINTFWCNLVSYMCIKCKQLCLCKQISIPLYITLRKMYLCTKAWRILISKLTTARDQSRYVPSQWEPLLQCNDISHWLREYLDWSLHSPYLALYAVCGFRSNSVCHHQNEKHSWDRFVSLKKYSSWIVT